MLIFTLQRELLWQKSNMLNWDLARISVIKFHMDKPWVLFGIRGIRLGNRSWIEAGELLAPVGAHPARFRQESPGRGLDVNNGGIEHFF